MLPASSDLLMGHRALHGCNIDVNGAGKQTTVTFFLSHCRTCPCSQAFEASSGRVPVLTAIQALRQLGVGESSFCSVPVRSLSISFSGFNFDPSSAAFRRQDIATLCPPVQNCTCPTVAWRFCQERRAQCCTQISLARVLFKHMPGVCRCRPCRQSNRIIVRILTHLCGFVCAVRRRHCL